MGRSQQEDQAGASRFQLSSTLQPDGAIAIGGQRDAGRVMLPYPAYLLPSHAMSMLASYNDYRFPGQSGTASAVGGRYRQSGQRIRRRTMAISKRSPFLTDLPGRE